MSINVLLTLVEQYKEAAQLIEAAVWGNFDEDEGTITGNIGRSPKDRQKMFVFADGSDGKHAVTHWKVLKRYGYVTLVECRLETGRTHQIRVHMAWIGHPLFNDERYGGDRILKGTTFSKYPFSAVSLTVVFAAFFARKD